VQCKKKKHNSALPNFLVFALRSFFYILSCVQNLLGEHLPVQPVLVLLVALFPNAFLFDDVDDIQENS
jgi:hypothetical protein